eukprot:966927-Pelagomonas_calceolata.AAC.3
MVHSVRIKDGTATYCNRYVETSRLKQEKKAGKPVFAAFADQEGRRGVIIALLELLKSLLKVCISLLDEHGAGDELCFASSLKQG